MKHTFLVVFIALPILQYALSAPAFAQAKVVVGGVEMESEVGVPGVLGDVDDDLEEVGEDDEDSAQRSWEPVVAPIPSRNPVFGWMLSVPAMLMYKPSFVEPEDRVWISGLFGFYAENESWGAGLMQRMSFGGDKWRVMGSLFHAEMNYRYYGIGGGGERSIVLDQDMDLFLAEGLRKHGLTRRLALQTLVLAGGKGERLSPLTLRRAKPSVAFGGKYKIIDFVLSNLFNSGIKKVYILTQYRAYSLNKHLRESWGKWTGLGDFFVGISPETRSESEEWFRGTADAILQYLRFVESSHADYVAVFGGDHIYKMDVTQMISFHRLNRADITIAALEVPFTEASRFGIFSVDKDARITGFAEKPEVPETIPGRETCFASMGNYIFNTEFLCDILTSDARNLKSSHDFGNDILPSIIEQFQVPLGQLDRLTLKQQSIPGILHLLAHLQAGILVGRGKQAALLGR